MCNSFILRSNSPLILSIAHPLISQDVFLCYKSRISTNWTFSSFQCCLIKNVLNLNLNIYAMLISKVHKKLSDKQSKVFRFLGKWIGEILRNDVLFFIIQLDGNASTIYCTVKHFFAMINFLGRLFEIASLQKKKIASVIFSYTKIPILNVIKILIMFSLFIVAHWMVEIILIYRG